MEQQGIEVTVLDAPECIRLMESYYEQHPEVRTAFNRQRTPIKL